MEVTLAVLADCANLTSDGKVNIMGIFGEINPPELPFMLPTMFLAIRFSASPAEVGLEKHLSIVLHNDEGKQIFKLESKAVVPEANRPGSKTLFDSIVGMNMMVFE